MPVAPSSALGLDKTLNHQQKTDSTITLPNIYVSPSLEREREQKPQQFTIKSHRETNLHVADVDFESGEEEQGDYATFVPKRRLVPISEPKDEGSSSKFRRTQSRTKGSILKQSSRAGDSRTHATMTADARASRNQQSSHGHLGGLGSRERSKFGRGGSSGVERRTERYDYRKPYQQASTIYRPERSW